MTADRELVDAYGLIVDLKARIEVLEGSLREIAKGEGRFSRDPLTHATNTIEDMKAIAEAALRGEEKP